jgi:septal ring factor EnvC (AmiA/AmiB activator)
MSALFAAPLTQAREQLIVAAEERLTLIGQLKEQGRKIADLEREVQKQTAAASQAQAALADARREIEALRAQLPDAATVNAFEALNEFLAAPAETHPALRISIAA